MASPPNVPSANLIAAAAFYIICSASVILSALGSPYIISLHSEPIGVTTYGEEQVSDDDEDEYPQVTKIAIRKLQADEVFNSFKLKLLVIWNGLVFIAIFFLIFYIIKTSFVLLRWYCCLGPADTSRQQVLDERRAERARNVERFIGNGVQL